jgi:predicted ATPase
MSRETDPIRVAVTGGPGAGKTSLLEGLELRGYAVVPEVARKIIADRKTRRLSPRPSPIEFANAIVQRDVEQYEATRTGAKLIFFDRSLLDSPQGTVDERCAFVLRTLQMGDAWSADGKS